MKKETHGFRYAIDEIKSIESKVAESNDKILQKITEFLKKDYEIMDLEVAIKITSLCSEIQELQCIVKNQNEYIQTLLDKDDQGKLIQNLNNEIQILNKSLNAKLKIINDLKKQNNLLKEPYHITQTEVNTAIALSEKETNKCSFCGLEYKTEIHPIHDIEINGEKYQCPLSTYGYKISEEEEQEKLLDFLKVVTERIKTKNKKIETPDLIKDLIKDLEIKF